MNTGYILWFGALVVVTGAALLWLAIGSVPEVRLDPEPGGPGDPDEVEPATRPTVSGEPPAAAFEPEIASVQEEASGPGSARRPEATRGPEEATVPERASGPGPASEAAGEDGIARPA